MDAATMQMIASGRGCQGRNGVLVVCVAVDKLKMRLILECRLPIPLVLGFWWPARCAGDHACSTRCLWNFTTCRSAFPRCCTALGHSISWARAVQHGFVGTQLQALEQFATVLHRHSVWHRGHHTHGNMHRQ